MEEKQLLIQEILALVNANKSSQTSTINPNYLDFFELEDLIDIRDGLLKKSEEFKNNNNSYLDEIFSKCS
jgi:hypothetical protein